MTESHRSTSTILIREATPSDHDAIWALFQNAVATGEVFVWEPGTTREEAWEYWFNPSGRTFVAEREARVVGVYLLKPNQVGRGSHVANAGYMVSSECRGLGIGRALGEHSLDEARRQGYRAMQFNFVVSTNRSAVHLWESLGFRIVGTLPGAFRHEQEGFVDVFVMFRSLVEDDEGGS